MSLLKFFQTIDHSFIGKLIDTRTKVFEATDPDRIYVENIRSFYKIPFFAAKFFCELAVREGVFRKKYGVTCPNEGRLILTVDNLKQIPQTIKCQNCELNERPTYEFQISKSDIVEFYQLKDTAK